MDLFSALEERESKDQAHKDAHKDAHKKTSEKAIPASDRGRAADKAGLAVVDPCVRSGDISSGRAKVGDEIVYRALFAGGYYRAKVIAVRFHGGVDIDVFTDSGRRLLHLTRRPVAEDAATCAEGECYLGDLPKR